MKMTDEAPAEEEYEVDDTGYIDEDDDDAIERYYNDPDAKNRRNPSDIQFTKLMIDTSKDVPSIVLKDKKDRLLWSMMSRHRQTTMLEDQAALARKMAEDRSVYRTMLWSREGDLITQNDISNVQNYSRDLSCKALQRGERIAYVLRQQNVNTKTEINDGMPKPEPPQGGLLSGIGSALGFRKKRMPGQGGY